MRLYKRGKIWWLAIGDTRESTGLKDKGAAEILFKRRQRELADPNHAAADAATLSEAVASTISTLEKTKRKDGSPTPAGTIHMYKVKTGHLLRLLPERLAEIDPIAVSTYCETRDEEGAETSTIYKEWSCLSRVLQEAERKGLYSGTIAKLKPEWVTGASVPCETFLTVEECERLLGALSPERRSVVALILATGMRWSEVSRFEIGDLEAKTMTVRIRGTKTSGSAKPIVIPESYRPLLAHVTTSAVAWANVRRDLHVAARRADRAFAATVTDRQAKREGAYCPVMPPVSPNDLRRTFASLLVQAGTSLEVVAQLLRHTSVAMVFRTYGKHTPESLAALARPVTSGVPDLYRTPRTPKKKTEKTVQIPHTPEDPVSPESSMISSAHSRNRTRDTGIFNPLLYQLS